MSSQRANRSVICGVGLGIGGGEVAERRVGEHDAEAERVGRAVALVDDDVVLGRAALDQDAEVQPGRASADAGDLHGGNVADPAPGAPAVTDLGARHVRVS